MPLSYCNFIIINSKYNKPINEFKKRKHKNLMPDFLTNDHKKVEIINKNKKFNNNSK